MKKHSPHNEISPGIIRADLVAAEQAIQYFRTHKTKDIKNVAAYHLQQACEKLIKIQIYDASVKIDNAKLYTHNLVALLSYAEDKNINIVVPDYIKDNALEITKWEAGSRYGLGISVRINSLEKCLAIGKEWSEEVL